MQRWALLKAVHLLQVEGTCNPDWGPISWPDELAQELSSSSSIAICVYAHADPNAWNKRPVPGHIASQSVAIQQNAASHNTSFRESGYQITPLATVEPPHQSPAAIDHTLFTAAPVTDGDSSDSGTEHEWERQTLSAHDTDLLHAGPDSPATSDLLISAEVDLDKLHVFQDDLAALDVYLPPNTLILELADGLCLFPLLNLGGESPDLASAADSATVSLPVGLSTAALQDQAAAAHAMADIDPISEQVRTARLTCISPEQHLAWDVCADLGAVHTCIAVAVVSIVQGGCLNCQTYTSSRVPPLTWLTK